MKKIFSALLALAMSLSIGVVSFAAEINFDDVTEDDWFYDDIKTVVELGLINGKSADRYAPDDNLTYAEAIKLAACMNQFYTEGAVTLANGNPWYQPYADYCTEKGIIDKSYNYEENATRAGYMTIFANALPDEALKQINTVPDNSIPDVPSERDYAAAVYKLYRAGILTGVDDKHNCEPLINISRKEVAAIVARMMNDKKRTHFTVVSVNTDDTEQKDDDNAQQDETWEYVGNEYTAYETLIFSETPSDVSVHCGETAVFRTEVLSGRKPFTYRWQYLKDDEWVDFEDTADEKTSITGAEETTLTIKTSIPDVTELRCVVTDSVGKEHATQTAELTVSQYYTQEWEYVSEWKKYTSDGDDDDAADEDDQNADNNADNNADGNAEDEDNTDTTAPDAPAELKIETQPNDASVVTDKTAKFTVEVSGGTEPYSYQWQSEISLNGKRKQWLNLRDTDGSIGGTKTETLSVTGTKEGQTRFRCVITDGNGNKVTTYAAKLTVTEKKIVLPSRKTLSAERITADD